MTGTSTPSEGLREKDERRRHHGCPRCHQRLRPHGTRRVPRRLRARTRHRVGRDQRRRRPALLAHLLKHDTVYGPFPGAVEVGDAAIVVDGRRIATPAEADPAQLPWDELGVDVVIESTGRFRARADAAKHLEAGARKVIISAPAKEPDVTVALGVNFDEVYDPDAHQSSRTPPARRTASRRWRRCCTTTVGIRHGLMTTVHAYTGDQQLLDGPHKDLPPGPGRGVNLVPTSTGAAKALGLVIPELAGKLHGYRRPRPGADRLARRPDRRGRAADDGRGGQRALRQRADTGALEGILAYSEEPLVSSDIVKSPYSRDLRRRPHRGGRRHPGQGRRLVRQRVGLLEPARRARHSVCSCRRSPSSGDPTLAHRAAPGPPGWAGARRVTLTPRWRSRPQEHRLRALFDASIALTSELSLDGAAAAARRDGRRADRRALRGARRHRRDGHGARAVRDDRHRRGDARGDRRPAARARDPRRADPRSAAAAAARPRRGSALGRLPAGPSADAQLPRRADPAARRRLRQPLSDREGRRRGLHRRGRGARHAARGQAAVAIENARLYESATRGRGSSSRCTRSVRSLAGETDLDAPARRSSASRRAS